MRRYLCILAASCMVTFLAANWLERFDLPRVVDLFLSLIISIGIFLLIAVGAVL